MFCEQIHILECFLKDHVTMKTAENSALHHRNNFKMFFLTVLTDMKVLNACVNDYQKITP